MKNLATYIAALLVLMLATACHQEEDDLFAVALISLETDEAVTITQVQAQAQLTNINTRQVTTTADFEGSQLRVELLRGPYLISIEGVATCQDATGATRYRQFRAQTDFTELYNTGTNAVTLTLTFLD